MRNDNYNLVIKELWWIRIILGILLILLATGTIHAQEAYKGSSDADIKMCVHSDDYTAKQLSSKAYSMYRTMTKIVPFNEYSIALYIQECPEMTYKDVEIEMVKGHKGGWAYHGWVGEYPAYIYIGDRSRFTVKAHELGHAYTLYHSQNREDCMFFWNPRCRTKNTYTEWEQDRIRSWINDGVFGGVY